MTHYIGPAPKKKRAPRPGTSLMDLAAKRLPETKEWLRKTHPRGSVVTRATIRDESPGMSDRAWTTREAMSFCICRLLLNDKTLIRKGQGIYQVVFAL